MDSPSVCFVASHAFKYALEGHNIASVRIVEAAVKAGIDAKVVSLENDSVGTGKNLYSIKSSFKTRRKTSLVPSVREMLSSVPAMVNVKELNCDIIHLLNVTKEIFLLNGKLLGTRGSYVSHFFHSDFPFSAYPGFRIRSWLFRLGFFNHILSSNRLLVNYLTQELEMNNEKVHYVAFPVDVNRFRPRDRQKLRAKYAVEVNAPVIAYVGAIDQDRGFFSLLRAFREILRLMPQAILYICHPEKDARAYDLFRQYAVSHQLTEHIIASGSNPCIEEIYSLADVVALPFQKPYWVTSPPVVLVEAMASATPVVTTPVDSIKEIGTHMVDMIFSTPGDLDSLVNALVYALENRDEASSIGFRARENATRNFSTEAVGRQLRATYNAICGS